MIAAIKPWHALLVGTALLVPACDSAGKKDAKKEATAKKDDAKKADDEKAAGTKKEETKKDKFLASATPAAAAKTAGAKKKGFVGDNGEPCDTELEWYDDAHHDNDENWDDAEHFGWGDFDDDEEFDDHDEEFDEEGEPEAGEDPAPKKGPMRQRTKQESTDEIALSAPTKQFTFKCVPGSTGDYRSNRTRVTMNLQGGSLGFVATKSRQFSGYGGEGDRCEEYRKTLMSPQYLQGTIVKREVRYFRPWDGKCHTWVNTETGLEVNGVDFTLWGVSRTEPVDAEDDDCR